MARAKPYLENKRRKGRHSEVCARARKFSGKSLQKSPYYSAILFFCGSKPTQDLTFSQLLVCFMAFFKI